LFSYHSRLLFVGKVAALGDGSELKMGGIFAPHLAKVPKLSSGSKVLSPQNKSWYLEEFGVICLILLDIDLARSLVLKRPAKRSRTTICFDVLPYFLLG